MEKKVIMVREEINETGKGKVVLGGYAMRANA